MLADIPDTYPGAYRLQRGIELRRRLGEYPEESSPKVGEGLKDFFDRTCDYWTLTAFELLGALPSACAASETLPRAVLSCCEVCRPGHSAGQVGRGLPRDGRRRRAGACMLDCRCGGGMTRRCGMEMLTRLRACCQRPQASRCAETASILPLSTSAKFR